ncbi:DNA cytosine methyltransferase [Rhizobium laguerreae]|uniref:DNA cytosine methyltransferase n=1 Tax=Rhizobium laguerreae TaxID=1076926 RepID=UPI001FEC0E7D|nr:DNA cytosine methyltransferase [Rhizobium laguerreae]
MPDPCSKNAAGANHGVSEMMRSVELFVGAGGLGIGVSQAGFKPAAVMDWDRWACDTLRENKERGLDPVRDWPLHECDVRDFDFGSIAGDIDLVTGGPPCQPFSMGGRHRAFLDSRDMFPQAIRAVRALRPKAFIFENVKGLTRSSFSNYLEYIRLQLAYPDLVANRGEEWLTHLARLEDHHTRGRTKVLQYRVLMRVLNAANYGVPQRRERVFLVGFRADTEVEWHFPTPTHSRDALLWSQWREDIYWDLHQVAKKHRPQGGAGQARALAMRERPKELPWRTVRDAIADLPDPELSPRRAHDFHDHRFQPGARSYPGHTGSPLDEPAKTLKAGVHGVPGGENMLRRPDGSIRYFTVRESARLQTFPDDMIFHGSWTETMRQLGNAVPCELGRIVAAGVRNKLLSD